jgi:dsDNA-specific endonuclease/ATPase MutS2
LEKDKVEIAGDDGFDYILSVSAIVSEGKSKLDVSEIKDRLKSIQAPTVTTKEKQDVSSNYRNLITDYLISSQKNWTPKDRDFLEIDLHIEEIVEKPRLLSDGLKLETQLSHARLCLEEALALKIRRVIFIHGVGSGVLRHELRQWLNTLSYLNITNADHRRYGIGATEVRINSNL